MTNDSKRSASENLESATPLESQAALLRMAGRVARLGWWTLELPERRVTWSPETCAIHEVEPGAVPSFEDAIEFYAPEYRAEVSRQIEACIQEGTPMDLEMEIVAANGKRKWVRALGEALRDARGRVTRIQGALQDISLLKQAEAVQRQLVDRLTATFESITDAFFILDAEWRFEFLNREAERLLRHERYALIGRNIWESFPDAVGSEFESQYHCAVMEDRTVAFEAYFPPLETWFAVRAYPSPQGLAVYFRNINAERKTREDLRVSEERFQLLSKATNDAIWDWNLLTDTLWWNEGFESLFGYRRDRIDPTIQSWHRHVHPEDRDAVIAKVKQAIESGDTTWSGEYRFLRKDGSVAYVLDRGHIIRNEFGKAVRMIGGMTDLTERQRAHEAVLTMARGISAGVGEVFFERLTKAMVESMGAWAGFVARIDDENAGLARTLCVARDGKVVENFEYNLPASFYEQWQDEEVWVTSSGLQKLYPHSRATEGKVEAQVAARLVDSRGRLNGVMCVQYRSPLKQSDFISSTMKIFAARAGAEIERMKVDAKTREQAALLDKARDAIIVRSLDHRIEYWNRGAELMYGWTADEVVGRSIRDLLYSDPSAFDAAVDLVFRRGEWMGELTQIRKDGSAMEIEGRWTLVRNEDGTPQSVLAINTDVTERKRLEQQFLRSQRMESIGTLAGGIAHDLNNLLGPILLGVELLKQAELDEADKRVLVNMESSARRGSDLVRQVLSFARGVEGIRVSVDLVAMAREMESVWSSAFPKSIRIETVFSEDSAPVLGDPTQLNQVMLNLCVNARDAMPHGGRVRIALRNAVVDGTEPSQSGKVEPGHYTILEVADEGVGIAPEVFDRIFEPFFSTKEVGVGTGLGLSTLLGIVRSHGGFVQVESELGKGSVFRVYLPSEEPGESRQDVESRMEALPRGKGELVLVVDDESSILDITQQTLEAFGYRTVAAEDGAQALQLYDQHASEMRLVLTDMMMPTMDGGEFIAALRGRNQSLPIIAVSGLGNETKRAAAAKAGATCFLDKPYSAEALLRLIKSIV